MQATGRSTGSTPESTRISINERSPSESGDRKSTVSHHHGPAAKAGNPLACEACHRRKVRCIFDGPDAPCVNCTRWNIKCVFNVRKEKRETVKRTQYVRQLEERIKRAESILKAAGVLQDENSPVQSEPVHEDDDSELDDDSDADTGSPYESISSMFSKIRKETQTLDGRPGHRNRHLQFRTRGSATHTPDLTSPPSGFSSMRPSSSPTSTTGSLDHANSVTRTKDMQVPLWKLDERDESRYIGRSSSLSILSEDGIEWIKEKAGDVSFLKVLSPDPSRGNPWDSWRADVFPDLFASKVFKPLPPRAEVFALLRDYFRTVNCMFPLYHEPSFMRLVEWQYTQQTCDDAARWASINIMISLAYEYRFSNSLKPERDKERSWAYFKNAMAVFTELALRRTDLLSVQALLGLAIFVRGNTGTQSSLPIVLAAIRSCHRMGLHRNVTRPNLSAVEQEQRKRVFWIAYILDQSTCIRMGTAPTQHVDDLDVDLPEEVQEDEDTPPETHRCNLPFFRQLCRLTLIRGRIYSELYTAEAQERSPEIICRAVSELARELQEWRDSSRTDTETQKSASKDFLLGFPSIGLQLIYYNCLIMVHRVPLILQYYYSRPELTAFQDTASFKALNAQAFSSGVICMQAARDTLKLVNNMPWGDVAWIWSMLYYVFLAVILIFSSILAKATQPTAREDLKALNVATTFFGTLNPTDGPSNYARFMARMCANFEHTAKAVIEREEKKARVSRSDEESAHSRPDLTVPSAPTQQQEASRPAQMQTSSAGGDSHRPRQPNNQSDMDMQSANAAVRIPHIDGLPRINSSGYFIAGSPGVSETHPPQPSISFDMSDLLQQSMAAAPSTSMADATSFHHFQTTMSASGIYQQPPTVNHHHHHNHLSGPPPEDHAVPEFFQIPLTADWEMGHQLFGNHFVAPGPPGFPPQTSYPTTTTMATTAMPIQASPQSMEGETANMGYYTTQAHPESTTMNMNMNMNTNMDMDMHMHMHMNRNMHPNAHVIPNTETDTNSMPPLNNNNPLAHGPWWNGGPMNFF